MKYYFGIKKYFKIKNMRGYKTLKELKEKEGEGGFVISEWDNNNNSTFYRFNDYLEYYKNFEYSKYTYSHFEVIDGNQYQRNYIDIDCGPDKIKKFLDIEGVETLEEIKNLILDFIVCGYRNLFTFDDIAGRDMNNGDLAIFSSHDEEKISFHFILTKFLCKNAQDNKNVTLRIIELMRSCYSSDCIDNLGGKIFKEISEAIISCIDLGLYKSTQQFRMAFNVKPRSNRVKIPYFNEVSMGACHKYKFEIGEKVTEKTFFIRILEKSLITYTTSSMIILNPKTHEQKIEHKSEMKIKVVDTLDDNKVNFAVEKFGKYLEDNNLENVFTVREIDGNKIQLKREKESYCKECNKIHEHENPFLIYNDYKIYYYCGRNHDDKGKLQGIIIYKKIDFKIPDPNELIISKCLVPYIKNDLVSYDTKKYSFYYWDNKTLLWEKYKYTDSRLIRVLEKYIYIYLDEKSKKLQSMKNELGEEKYDILLKRLHELYRVTLHDNYIIRLLRILSADLYDKSIIYKIDGNPNILAVKNGYVIDFEKCVCVPRTREHYCSIATDVNYNPHADTSLTEKYFMDLTLDNIEYKEYLKKLFGYFLTGRVELKQIYICYGPYGDNGKSTLFNIMKDIMGDYYLPAGDGIFTKTKNRPDNSIADIKGKRMVVESENDVGKRANESLLKSLSGADWVVGRHLYDENLSFVPCCKAILLTNDPPQSTNDTAYWDRLVLLPFLCEFKDNPIGERQRKVNRNFIELMRKEENKEGFLKWLIEGVFSYMKNPGVLELPKCLQDYKEEYKEKVNSYGQFVKDLIEITLNNNDYIKAKDLHESYNKYAEINGYKMISSNIIFGRFISKELKIQSINKKIDNLSTRIYPGIKWNSAAFKSVNNKTMSNEMNIANNWTQSKVTQLKFLN